MEHCGDSILFYQSKTRSVLGLAACLICAVFSIYVIITIDTFKWLSLAALAFFLYKGGLAFYNVFFRKKVVAELRKKDLIIADYPPLPFKALEAVCQKRITVGSESRFYVCLKTEENKFKLTDEQKENIVHGLTAFCFRPSEMSRKDADFLVRELLAKIHQKPL